MKNKNGKQISLKFALIVIALFFTSMAFAQHTAHWTVPDAEKVKKNPYASDESSKARGKKTYKLECFRCHGKEGRGDGSSADLLDKQPADLTTEKVQNQTDGELFWKISEGRKPMPLAKRTLTDDQRWDIINYIRTFKNKS
jgi:mono/diheme cytochrome c family protein